MSNLSRPDRQSLTRRRFLKRTVLSSASVALIPAWKASAADQVAGANSDVRIAVLGLNGRGKNHSNKR